MKEIRGKLDASKRKFVIIVSRWNELITKELAEGALEELKRHGAKKTVVIHVSGTWEIPPVAKKLLASKKKPDGIIALGCIMQGQTPHAKLLGSDVGGALMSLQTKYVTPVTWGILTPDTQEQALDRAGLKMGNKGREAALAAIELADVLSQIE
jgi:6,7-dimethyl-8-ribityllumazine synthase